MPTGYTAQLENMDYNLEKWLTESIPRAMGMCVMLRDEPSNLSLEEIRKKLSEETEYIKSCIVEDEAKLADYLNKPEEKWKIEFNDKVKKDKKYYSELNKEWKFKREKHLESLKRIDNLMNIARDKVILSVLSFAKSQLDLVISSEYTPKCEPKYRGCSSWKEYRDTLIDTTKDSLVYSKKSLEKSIIRNKERLESFDTYVSFVKKLKDIN